jgi:hypothetical protein
LSREHPFLTTPVAILLAGVAIGVGLYAGPRAPGHAELPPGAAPQAVPTAPRTLPGPDGRPAPVRRVDPATVQQAARDAVQRALAAQRAALVAACWAPVAGSVPSGSTVSWILDVTFNAAGAQVARGVRSVRPAGFSPGNPPVITPAMRAQSSVTGCVQRTLPPLSIPAPGRNVRVELESSLP